MAEAEVKDTEQPKAETTTPAETPKEPDATATAQAALAQAQKLRDEAEQRERNAREALRAANDRGRETREEREAARREAAEAKAAAMEAQRIARDMEAGLQVLADADPDSPASRIIMNARKAGGGNGRGAAPQDEDTKRKLESIAEELGETRRYIAGTRLREAHAAVESEVRSLWNNSHKPALEGVVDPEKFVARVRKEVLTDPVMLREGVDEQTARARIAEITRDIASEYENVGVKYNERWKSARRPDSGAPTSKGSAPAVPATGQKRVRYDPTKPGSWDEYKKALGAST